MSFRVTGLSPEPFLHLFGLPGEQLRKQGAQRCVADRRYAFPDRIELRDVEPGETLLLLNYVHQPASNAYRSSHAIFVREGAETPYDRVNEIPEVMRIRPMSLRAFDAQDLMADADLCDGRETERLIERFLANPSVAYIHAHYAKRGCYAARIERA